MSSSIVGKSDWLSTNFQRISPESWVCVCLSPWEHGPNTKLLSSRPRRQIMTNSNLHKHMNYTGKWLKSHFRCMWLGLYERTMVTGLLRAKFNGNCSLTHFVSYFISWIAVAYYDSIRKIVSNDFRPHWLEKNVYHFFFLCHFFFCVVTNFI